MTVESLKRTLSTHAGTPRLSMKDLPDATLSSQLKVAQTRELGQVANLVWTTMMVELRGSVLCVVPPEGTKHSAGDLLLQTTFITKLPPPPTTGFSTEAITQAEGMLKHQLTLVIYTISGCYWVSFENAGRLMEWEKASREQYCPCTPPLCTPNT